MFNSSSCYDNNYNKGNPEEYAIKIIEHYTNLVDKQLNDIIDLAQNLERVHLYSDFNCRTFCILILNRELIKNNFSPVALEDPNVFDWQSLIQLQASLQAGQKNFQNLFNNGLVHTEDQQNAQWLEYINIQLTDHQKMSSILEEFKGKLLKKESWSKEKWSEYNEQSKELQNAYRELKKQVKCFEDIDIEYHKQSKELQKNYSEFEKQLFGDIDIDHNLDYNDELVEDALQVEENIYNCLLYTSPSPRDRTRSRMPSSA